MSPAAYQDDTRFSGSGVLRVLRDSSGTLILLLLLMADRLLGQFGGVHTTFASG